MMNKGDIKATIILLFYIVAGLIGGVMLEKYNINKDGVAFVFGFILGVLACGLMNCMWIVIRLNIND